MKTMSRIEKLFADNQKARIAYLTAGDGGIQHTLDAALALINGSVNLLEIGIPFSDPVADGPVIQRASQRAIAAGTNLQDVLWLIKKIREESDIPLILFSYLNPILASSQSDFLRQAKMAGIDGLLLVDCPIEESQIIRDTCVANQIDLIYVMTPSTPLTRIQYINQHAEGFLYYACRKGTTGVRHGLPEGFQEKMASIKSIVNLPVVVGFGISNNAMAQEVYRAADGVVVGSLFVKALEEGLPLLSLSKLAQDIFASTPT
jgi:tryptophan synthase alpha chain